jgi:hypothetical protein
LKKRKRLLPELKPDPQCAKRFTPKGRMAACVGRPGGRHRGAESAETREE